MIHSMSDAAKDQAVAYASLSLVEVLLFELINRRIISVEDARGIIKEQVASMSAEAKRLEDGGDSLHAKFFADMSEVVNDVLQTLNLDELDDDHSIP